MKMRYLVPARSKMSSRSTNAEAVKAATSPKQTNGPLPARRSFRAPRVIVLPDILANAGGVTVSYFEWVQNQEGLMWTSRKSTRACKRYGSCLPRDGRHHAQAIHVPPRAGAMILAVGRVSEATLVRGLFP